MRSEGVTRINGVLARKVYSLVGIIMQDVTAEVEPQVTGSHAFPAERNNVAVDHNPSKRGSIELRQYKHMRHP
jgi:hypothetical protein